MFLRPVVWRMESEGTLLTVYKESGKMFYLTDMPFSNIVFSILLKINSNFIVFEM